jgi:hypothetical protein
VLGEGAVRRERGRGSGVREYRIRRKKMGREMRQ